MTHMLKSFVLALSLTLFGVLAFAQQPTLPDPIDFGPKQTVDIRSGETVYSFQMEIADTDEKQARGFMFREQIPDDEGMLFTFAEPKVASIWMKNTPMPLDILFVQEDGKIVKIEHWARPYSLRRNLSEAEVSGVVELVGGQAKMRGIKPGDVVVHEFFGNTAP